MEACCTETLHFKCCPARRAGCYLADVPHMCRLSAAILFLQETNQLEAKSWLCQHDVSAVPPPPAPAGQIEGAAVAQMCSGGEDEVLLYRAKLAGCPQNTFTPPLCAFKLARLLSSQLPVSSYQWQPDGEHTSSTSRLVDRAVLAEKAVVVQRSVVWD